MQVIEANSSRLMDFRKEFGKMNAYIAGGAILSNATKSEISDYDIYPKTKKDAADICCSLLGDNCFLLSITDRAITFKSNSLTDDKGQRAIIQVMIFDDFDSPKRIFDYFDFTVCMGAQDLENGNFIFHDDFWADVAAKNLRFNPGTRYPLNSMLRVSKYRSKGYYISKSEHVKIALAVANAGMPKSWEELENMIGGTYGKSLRLNREGEEKEFNLENAMSILSEVDISNCLYTEEDMTSKLDDCILAEFVEYGSVKYVPFHNDKDSMLRVSKRLAISRDGDILDFVDHKCDAIADHFVESEPDQEVSFYVRATEAELEGDEFVGSRMLNRFISTAYANQSIFKITAPASAVHFGFSDKHKKTTWGVNDLVVVNLIRATIVPVTK